ncbi:unnamed protein product [Lactuca virosa]|uniref:SAC domain-containing protein n=1 Tax=Lactuca virosa TaxID=75947 RepID=A0AAU9MAV1_9ASTR|nr:unnamed protein product [Lactuca virosa]
MGAEDSTIICFEVNGGSSQRLSRRWPNAGGLKPATSSKLENRIHATKVKPSLRISNIGSKRLHITATPEKKKLTSRLNQALTNRTDKKNGLPEMGGHQRKHIPNSYLPHLFKRLQEYGEVNLETASRMYTIFGVAGTIRLLAGTYVLVITSRKEIGTYLGYPIFRVMSRKFLCCNEGLSNLNNQQVRGSIPLLWEQIVDLSYKPRNFNLVFNWMHPMVVKRHFHDLMQRYGDTIVVDLTDQHGNESLLNLAFATEMEKLPDVR